MSAHGGILRLDGGPIDKELLQRLSLACAKYAPHDQASIVDGSFGAFYRAFYTTSESSIDPQPYVSTAGNIFIWDGRLDNANELANTVTNNIPGATSDVSFVCQFLERRGLNYLSKLEGDWGLVVWDPRRNRLDLGVDYLGIKHIYYSYREAEYVVWCSHLDALVLALRSPLTLNDAYVAGYLASYPDPEITPYQEVLPVAAATSVSICAGRRTVSTYWDFQSLRKVRCKTDQEYEEQFRHHFRTSVRRRLRSDSPVLAELSGGLDSSSIVCMADDIVRKHEHGSRPVDTISYYSTADPAADERHYSGIVEVTRGRKGSHVDLDSHFLSRSLEHTEFVPSPYWHGNPSSALIALQAIVNQNGNSVLLSGIGGDELLGGAPDPRSLLADLIFTLRPIKLMRQLMRWSLAKRTSCVHLFLDSVLLILPSAVQTRLRSDAMVAPWIDQAFVRRHRLGSRQIGIFNRVDSLLPSHRENLNNVLALRRRSSFVLPSPLFLAELRYPYLDRTLVEFLISIPADQLLRPGERRSLMRRSLSGLVPEEILQRRTKALTDRRHMLSFSSHWPYLQEIFKAPICAERGYVNALAFRRALADAKSGITPQLVRLLRVISLELWLRDLSSRGIINNRIASLPLGDRIAMTMQPAAP